MACKVSFNTNCSQALQDLSDSQIQSLAKWLSCNGEVWGVGPTLVFASAAAFFLYHELEATVFVAGDQAHVTLLEKTLVSTMILGMLALMVHLWVCSMRFFQYYLDTLIRDSPTMFLEMTTAGLLGQQAELLNLSSLTRFLRQQQPQIHITVCWFLSLCYADYVRKNYCQRFNMPYLEEWQATLHARASRGLSATMARVNSFVGTVHARLSCFSSMQPQGDSAHTVRAALRGAAKARHVLPLGEALQEALCPGNPAWCLASPHQTSWMDPRAKSYVCDSSVSPAKQPLTLLRNYAPLSPGLVIGKRILVMWIQSSFWQNVQAEVHETLEWAKCGESIFSTVPTMLWAVGTALVTYRLLMQLFRRFMFRRVPLWELVLQHLLFVWVVIYSVRFWVMLVRALKVLVQTCYDDLQYTEAPPTRVVMEQWVIWLAGLAPLAYFIHTRPRRQTPQLMIWITTNPWLRREMGPYGYYLNRPLTSLPSATSVSSRHHTLTLRRAFSDSKIVLKEPQKKKLYSKSV